MKKLLALSATITMGVCALVMPQSISEVKADTTSDLKALIAEYDGTSHQYTKKTNIYADIDKIAAEEGDASYLFHAGLTTQLERTTYYTEGALLMGDPYGGFSTINSGYANDGEGNMDHFSSKDGLNGLVDPEQRAVDYTVKGKTMEDYFYDLADIKEVVSDTTWTYEDGVYSYEPSLLRDEETNDYIDPVLKEVQYFAAPLLLTHKSEEASFYFTPSAIRISEKDEILTIKIEAEGDSGKIVDEGIVLAEARVIKGHVEGGFDVTINDKVRVSAFKNGDKEEYVAARVDFEAGDYLGACNLYRFDTWTNIYLDGSSTANFEIVDDKVTCKVAGKYNVYLKLGEPSSFYIEGSFVDRYIKGTAGSGWDPDPDYQMLKSFDSNNQGEMLNVHLNVGDFKISAYNWSDYTIGWSYDYHDTVQGTAAGNFSQGASDNNIYCKEAGNYNIFLTNNNYIYIDFVS